MALAIATATTFWTHSIMNQGIGRVSNQRLSKHLNTLFQPKFISTQERFKRCSSFSTRGGFPKSYSLHSPGNQDWQPLMMEDISQVQWGFTSKKGYDLNSHLASHLSSTVRRDTSKRSQNDGFRHSIRYYHQFLLNRPWEENLSNWSYKFTNAIYNRYLRISVMWILKRSNKKATEILLLFMSLITSRIV